MSTQDTLEGQEVVTPGPERIILTSETDSVQLRQLVPEDAQALFDLIAYNPEHLSQHGDTTAAKYPDPEAMLFSIEHPELYKPRQLRFGIWDGDLLVGYTK